MKKTTKMMTGVLTALVASTMTGCSSNTTESNSYYMEEISTEDNPTVEQTTIYEEENHGLDPNIAEESFSSDTVEETESSEELVQDEEINYIENEAYIDEPIIDPPADSDCAYWEWDEEAGAYYCEDTASAYANHYFYGGHYYPTQSHLTSNHNYQAYKNSSQFNSSSSYKSGIGSGSTGGFGG